jgi:serine/threonine-protein kinase
MELVEGDSLDELAMRADTVGKRLPARAVFRVIADACAGLHVAHELSQDGALIGLVHRDVSPQNILVSRLGIAKVIDFGIAKAKERLAPDTTTGYIKGKISFMAPEQARSEEVDRRADIWALGAVIYELLEGRPPFEAATDIGRLAALVGPTPVAPMGPQTPEPLRAVVHKTLQKQVSERYATAQQLKEAIELALIESELETSSDDVATLLAPYFHRQPNQPIAVLRAVPNDPSPVSALADTVNQQSGAVKVAELLPELSSRHETIEIPKRKSGPWGVALVAALAGIPAAWWALSPSNAADEEPSATGASSVESKPAVESSPPAATTSIASAVSPGALSVTVRSATAASASAASASPPPSGTVAPALRKPPKPPRIDPPPVDPNGIE